MKSPTGRTLQRCGAAKAQQCIAYAALAALIAASGCSVEDKPSAPLHHVGGHAAYITQSLAGDNFNRPDESPIAGNWVSGPSGFVDLALSTGAVRGITYDAFGAAYWRSTWAADQWSQARVSSFGTTGAGGVGVRIDSSTQSAYVFGVGGGGTWYALAKFVNGAYTEFTRQPLAFVTGDTIRLEVQGDTLRAYRNSGLVISMIDNSIASGSSGLLIYHNDAAFLLDDWQGGGWDNSTPPPSPPAAPSNLAASATSSSSAHLVWADNASNETGFRLERCTGSGCGSFTEMAVVGANVVSYDDAGLAAGTSYTWRVRAYNSAGVSSYSNTASATTQPASTTDQLPDLGMARLADFSIKMSGSHHLLYFSMTVVNIGTGPFELRGQRASTSDSLMQPVVQRIYNTAGGSRDVTTNAVMVYSGDGHNHWHVRDLETVQLFPLSGGNAVASGNKRGFCFWDGVAYRLSLPGAPQSPVYGEPGCGRQDSLHVAMGLSVGWGDIYPSYLPNQYIEITGLPDGNYRLMVTADMQGIFVEANRGNNATWADLQISGGGKHVHVLGYGP